MRNLSLWAREHIVMARALVVILHITLITTACWLGYMIADEGLFFTPTILYFSIAIWVTSALVYPRKKKQTYRLRKACDFALAASTFLIFTYATNTEGLFDTQRGSAYANTSLIVSQNGDPTAAEILASLQYRDKSTLTKKEKRILKREFKKQIGIYIKAKFEGDDEEGNRAGLIILTIVAALGLLYLVAAIACNLSCNGMDGAAIAVGLIGTAGIVWATVAIIRRINRGPRKKEETETQ